jgi:biopolymer transport protein ExbD
MPDRMRLVSAGCIVFALFAALPARSKPAAPPEAQYRPADSNFYFTRDVKVADPDAVILPETSFRQQDGIYYYVPRRKAPREIYVREMVDWLEPVTPPSMPLTPEGLGIAPDEMQVREPHGDVTVALPASPSDFVPATDRMVIPDGTLVKTGPDGTAAVLLGGVNSLRLAPNTQASVEQTVAPDLRSTRIDLKTGAAFSKVGLRPGAAQDYEVRTPSGTVKVKGTDFLTVVGTDHTNVFLVQGVVAFDGPDGRQLALARSNGTGEPQIIQSELASNGGHGPPPPVIGEATMAFDFIPTVNVKVKKLREKEASGALLTPEETKYLGLLRRVPVLIKLALVAPTPSLAPSTVAAPAVAPVPPAPAPLPPPEKKVAQSPAPAPVKPSVAEKPAPAPEKKIAAKKPAPKPLAKLAAPKPLAKLAEAKPTPPPAPADADEAPAPAPLPAAMTNLAAEIVTPVDLSTPGQKMTTTEPAPKPKPVKPAVPKTKPRLASAPPKATPPVVTVPAPAPVASSKPLKATVHADGMVDFRGQKLSTAEFEAKLNEVMASKPHKILLLHASNDVPFANIKEIIDAGKQAGLQEVKLVSDGKKDSEVAMAAAPLPLAAAPTMKVQAMMEPRPVAPASAPPPPSPTVPDAPAEATTTASSSSVPQGPISPVKDDTAP